MTIFRAWIEKGCREGIPTMHLTYESKRQGWPPMSAVVELLQDMIRIPSVNPQGDAGTPHTGEAKIAKVIGAILEKMGMEVEFQEVEKDRPNVIGRLKSKHSRYHLLLGPHTDTVSVKGMTIPPFSGELRDGRVWGRGATDTKGPMCSMLVALQQMLAQGKRPEATDIWFAGLMGEESGNDGIEYLMKSDYFPKKGVRMDFGIAGEPTELKVVYRHKGALWLRIRTSGRSCHASIAQKGENAILKMQKVIEYVQGPLTAAYAALKDPELSPGGFNVTTIQGGSKINIIPSSCEVEVDHRSLPQEVHQEIIAKVRNDLSDCQVEVISDRPGLDTPADNPYIKKLSDVLGKHSGCVDPKVHLTAVPWFGDCSVMARDGVPAIAYGPGSAAQAHIQDEFIEVGELEKAVEIFREFFIKLD